MGRGWRPPCLSLAVARIITFGNLTMLFLAELGPVGLLFMFALVIVLIGGSYYRITRLAKVDMQEERIKELEAEVQRLKDALPTRDRR
jgi:hypothetical protein